MVFPTEEIEKQGWPSVASQGPHRLRRARRAPGKIEGGGGDMPLGKVVLPRSKSVGSGFPFFVMHKYYYNIETFNSGECPAVPTQLCPGPQYHKDDVRK